MVPPPAATRNNSNDQAAVAGADNASTAQANKATPATARPPWAIASHTGGLRLPPKRMPAIASPPRAASRNRTQDVCNRVVTSIARLLGDQASGLVSPMEYPSWSAPGEAPCAKARAVLL